MNELILGGQRSGKSRRAEQLAMQWLAEPAKPVSDLRAGGALLTPDPNTRCAAAEAPPVSGSSGTEMQGGKVAEPHREALFVATAQAHDDDMRARIARHRADRQRQLPAMQTVEETHDLAGVIYRHSQPHRLLVIDCLTLWLANHYDRIDGFIDSVAVSGLLQAIEQAPGPLVFVSNEIGLGVIPMGREVRAYVDALGWLNQQVAARCQRVCLMTAGLPLLLKGNAPLPNSHD